MSVDVIRPIREFTKPLNLARVKTDWIERLEALANDLRKIGIGFEIRVSIGDEEIGYWAER